MIVMNICTLLLALTFVKSEDDNKKWVWNNNARNGKNEKTPRKLQDRYEIYENDYDEFDNRNPGFGNYGSRPGGYLGGPGGQLGSATLNQSPFRPNKQPFSVQRPGGVYGQGGQLGGRPIGGLGSVLPQGSYSQGGGYGQGGQVGYGQGGYGQDGPNGPFPGNYGGQGGGLGAEDFSHGPPFKHFDTCTCTEKFNCRSPAVSYGHCDVAKSYCCYSKDGGLHISASPSRPNHSPENGVLVGPGGPTGIVGHPGGSVGHIGGGGGGFVSGRPGRPPYGGGFGGLGGGGYGSHNGVLLGPGGHNPRPGFGGLGGGGGGSYGSHNGVLLGPGGHNPRPGLIGLGPIHGPENGVLVGPGGPFDGPAAFGFGRKPPYARSAKEKDLPANEEDKD